MEFTTRKNNIDFTVDGQEFQTKSAIASGIIFRLQGTFSKLGEKDQSSSRGEAFDELKGVFSKILTQEAWVRFEPLLEGDSPDDATPIDTTTLVEIVQWLIGHGLGKDHMPPQDS